jgi:hypothetical protein
MPEPTTWLSEPFTKDLGGEARINFLATDMDTLLFHNHIITGQFLSARTGLYKDM